MGHEPDESDRHSCLRILEKGIERLTQRLLDLHPNAQHLSKQALMDILSTDPGLLSILSIVRGTNQDWDLTNDETGNQVPLAHMAGCALMEFMYGPDNWDADDLTALDP
jgi:hypothetical protein